MESVDYFLNLRGLSEEDREVLQRVQKGAFSDIVDELQAWIRAQYKNERVTIRQVTRGTPHAAAIRAEYTGRNMADLCRKYNVSRSTVWRCVHRAKVAG